MASKPTDVHLPGCRWAWDGSPCLCPVEREILKQGIEAGHLYPGPFPEVPMKPKVVYVEPFYREDYSPEAKAQFAKLAAFTMPAPDLLHPTGRCKIKDIPVATDIVDSADKDSYK